MRVLTVGGGPAGLYASLLLKKANPSWDVTVVERNPADATYGWGVVFSDRTLAEFREADLPTYRSITDHFVMWDAIDIRYRGTVVRCGGMPFAGIRRRTLLRILQDRCRELDVSLRFETPFDAAAVDADLLVGADGVRSEVRALYPDVFRTSLEEGVARYIWFGTNRILDSFTFSFRESEHGLFQAHAYPFDGTMSTFIVECREETWRAAGLDGASEVDSIAFCQSLFAEDLRGQRLLSNNSQWIRFGTVRNRTWRHGNVVLLGDAAHTAHFSIGSGTKLAMEDAIALARGFEAHPGDVASALSDYELERRPVVERFQEAAAESRTYFESTSRYLHMEPEQFAFHLLTRSGRIDYDQLRLRDPRYVATVDRWFSPAKSAAAPPPAHNPTRLRSLELRNRLAVSPPPTDGAVDGVPDTGLVEALAAAAGTGGALVVSPIVAVSQSARITSGCPGLYGAEHEAAWRAIAERIEAAGARLCVRLGHAGRRGATRPRHRGVDRPLADGGWPLMAPSPLPYLPGRPAPRQMEEADLRGVTRAFIDAAERAARAGVAMLQVHMAHGYLLASFLSPLTNRRTDGYGGTLRDRLRFPLQVFDAVRSAWPEDRPLAAAIPASDWAREGLSADDAVAIARALREHGCDLVEPLAGQTVFASRPDYDRWYLAAFADRIRNEAGIATMVSGGITTIGAANTLVAGGRADLCVLASLTPPADPRTGSSRSGPARREPDEGRGRTSDNPRRPARSRGAPPAAPA